MNEFEVINEYSNKLLDITNKIKLLDNEFPDYRLVENILVIIPKRDTHLLFH